jgi:hypothetical protein
LISVRSLASDVVALSHGGVLNADSEDRAGLPVELPPQDDRPTKSEQGVSPFGRPPIYVFLAFFVNISLSLRPAGYGAMQKSVVTTGYRPSENPI